MTRLHLSALAAALSIVMAQPSARAQEVTLRVHTFMPPVANPVKHFLQPWAEKVTKEFERPNEGPGLPRHAARRQRTAASAAGA